MKRLFVLLMALTLLLSSGCGAKDDANADGAADDENAVVTTGQENPDDEKTLEGTIDEIKDFMFVVTDENKASYIFSFEGATPAGLTQVSEGDKVIVTYTGEEINEVDPFAGTIVSIERVK